MLLVSNTVMSLKNLYNVMVGKICKVVATWELVVSYWCIVVQTSVSYTPVSHHKCTHSFRSYNAFMSD